MSWIRDIISSGTSDLISSLGSAIDRFVTTDSERQELKIKLQKLLQERDSEIEQTMRSELHAKERIIVAELKHGNNFTKSARPMVIYVGLVMILVNYTVAPLLLGLVSVQIPTLDLPSEFWWAWMGIVGTYQVGRTTEKIRAMRGTRDKSILE